MRKGMFSPSIYNSLQCKTMHLGDVKEWIPLFLGKETQTQKQHKWILQTLEMFISRFIHLMKGADPTVDQALI